ncbi:MAG: hypothetical protein ABR969_06085 [Sedimentisphaerales bacterium]
MKKLIVLVTLCLIAAIVVPVFAADKPAAGKPAVTAAKEETVKGKVGVVKDKEGKVTEVTLTAGDVKYMVTLDAEAKKLEALDGKEVKATGTVLAKGIVKWITVTKFEEVKAAAPKEAPKEAPKK